MEENIARTHADMSHSSGHQTDIESSETNYSEMVDSYFIQSKEEELRHHPENPLKLQYYFDSFDVINLVQGAWGYERGLKFDYKLYINNPRKILVYALAYNGLFGTIKMLPPHQLEFMKKIYDHKNFFWVPNEREQYLRMVNEVLQSFDLLTSRIDKDTNIDKLIAELKGKGDNIYKADYLLKGERWTKRFKNLINENYLHLTPLDADLSNVEDKKLYDKIKAGFDFARPSPSLSKNNLYDTLALYHLQKELEVHKQYRSRPLPVFFASSATVLKAVDYIRKRDSTLLCYELEGKLISVIRDSQFFILEAVFTENDRTKSFFEDWRKAKEQVKDLLSEERERIFRSKEVVESDIIHAGREFKQTVDKVINVKFIKEFLLKNDFYQDLSKELKKIISWNDSRTNEINDKVQIELDQTLYQAKIELNRTRKISAIVDAFPFVQQDVDEQLGNTRHEINVFRDFALMKFGLSEEKLPNLQASIDALRTYPDDKGQQHPAVSPIMHSLIKVGSNSPGEKIQFLNGLTVAWVLAKYSLIEDLCRDLDQEEDWKEFYPIPLIYSASIIAQYKNKNGRKEVQRVIDCIGQKNNQNYKIWLGTAFLYFQMWSSITNLKPDLPDINKEVWERQAKLPEYRQYIKRGAFKFLELARKYLLKKYGDDIKENSQRLLNYLYILNNIIYYTTKCGALEEFRGIKSLYDELESYDGYAEWQGRFYDTLGWYNLRLYLLNKDKTIGRQYLDMASDYYEQAVGRGAPPREKILYRQLKKALNSEKASLET